MARLVSRLGRPDGRLRVDTITAEFAVPRFAIPLRLTPARGLAVVLISFAVVATLVVASERFAEPAGLECHDYANTSWHGAAFQTRIERDFTTPLFATRPAGFVRFFSTDCRGALTIGRSGAFSVLLISHNPAELIIDGQPVLQTRGSRLEYAPGTVDLAAGHHQLRFRYAFALDGDAPELLMSPAGRSLRPLNGADLSQQPLSTAASVVLRLPPYVPRVVLPGLWIALVLYLLRVPLAERLRRAGAPLTSWHHSIASNARRSLAVLVTIAVAVRVVLSAGTYGILWPDSVQYYDTALSFLRGDFLAHNLISTPLFPAFLATFLSIGTTPEAGALMIAAQRALAVAATILVFRLASEVFDKTVAFYAALLWTVSALQLYYETVVATEALFVFVLILTIVAAARMLRTRSVTSAALVGLMCAVATLTRPVAKGLVPAVLAVMWWWGRERKRLILPSLVLVAVFCASVAPWMYVNRQTYGFWGISRGEGLWLFLRTFDIDEIDPPATTRFPEVKQVLEALRPTHPYLHYAVRDELNYQRGYSASQADEVMFGFALEAVAAHPVRFAVGTVKQLALLLVAPYRSVQICDAVEGPYLCSERGADLSFRAFPNTPPPDRKPLKTAIAAYFRVAYWVVPLLWPFAVVGMVRALRERHACTDLAALLVITVLYLTVATALFNTVQDRYRLPADAFAIMFAVAELRRLVHRPQSS
jgi:4-amino-4-deoxy-L-arabinose transferase-like glycosyltransferase